MRIVEIIFLSLFAIFFGLFFIASTLCTFSKSSMMFPGFIFMVIFGALTVAPILRIAKLSKDIGSSHTTALNLNPPHDSHPPTSTKSDNSSTKENS